MKRIRRPSKTAKNKSPHLSLIIITMVLIIIILLIAINPFYMQQNNSKNGLLSLTFDDGLLAHYEVVYPLMKERGINGTAFILANFSGLFENQELMSFEQARKMQDSGWEIGSHTLDHKLLTILPDNKLENELQNSKKILEAHGFNIYSIAYPFGYQNEKVIEKAKKYYSIGRPMKWGYNLPNKIAPYLLSSKWIKEENSPEEVCSWIKKAKEENLWLILDFHYIGKEKRSNWDVPLSNFEKILDCVSSSGINVKTIKEVIENQILT